MPQWLAEIRFWAAARLPPIVLLTAPLIEHALRPCCRGPSGRSCPSRSGCPRRGSASRKAPTMATPDLVARDDLRPRRVALDGVGRGVVDPDPLEGVAEVHLARAVGADQVVDDGDLGRVAGSRALVRRSRCRAGSRRSRCPGRSCCSASRGPRPPRRCPGSGLPSAVRPIMLLATVLPVPVAGMPLIGSGPRP